MSDSNNADGGDRKRRQTNTEYDDQGSEEGNKVISSCNYTTNAHAVSEGEVATQFAPSQNAHGHHS